MDAACPECPGLSPACGGCSEWQSCSTRGKGSCHEGGLSSACLAADATVYMYLEWVPIISAGVIFRFLVCLLVSGESLIGVVGGLDWC